MNPRNLKHSVTWPPDGQGVSLFTSVTEGTVVYITPGGWAVLHKVGKWLFATGGWLLYMISRWIEHGI